MQTDESKIKWRQFISGDNDSYSWIYSTYVQVLYRYGLRFTADSEIVKDCIQEVFTSLYKNKNHLITPDNIKVYLLVSLKNCLIRTLYKESLYDHELPENIQFSLEPTVEEEFISNEHYANQQKKIKEILSLLSPRQKEIIYYRYIQELSMDEICILMNLNYQSAQNLIQRSLKKVRNSYNSIEMFLLILSISLK
ncbi:RNA polymerase sigma factor [Parabacteroides sp.]